MPWKNAAHVFCDEFIFDLLQIPKVPSVLKQHRTEEKFPSIEVMHSFTPRLAFIRLLPNQSCLQSIIPQGYMEELMTFGNPERYPNHGILHCLLAFLFFRPKWTTRPRPTGIPQAVT